jgi:hypothetical protein
MRYALVARFLDFVEYSKTDRLRVSAYSVEITWHG